MAITYKDAAQQGFTLLSPLYFNTNFPSSEWGGRFWCAGNCLHTCLNFLLYTNQTDQQQLLSRGYQLFQRMGLNNLTAISWTGGYVTAMTTTAHGVQAGQRFQISGVTPSDYNGTFTALTGTTGNTLVYALVANPGAETVLGTLMGPVAGWWVDDYGWWGIALQLALKNRVPLGYGDVIYDGWFNNIEMAITICWNRMYSNWDPSPYSKTDIKGGIWNTPNKGADPSPLAGRNSVTNELFWILSYRQDSNSDEFKAIDSWFQQWLELTGQTGILSAGDADEFPPRGLVLERPEGNSLDTNWTWTGDQGLFFTGLRGSSYPNPPDIANAVLGDPPTSYGLRDSDGVVHETFSTAKPFRDFDLDYAAGKGVLLRYMGGASAPNGGPFLYPDFAKTNARAVWCNQGNGLVPPGSELGNKQFGLNWNPNWVPPPGWTGIKPEIAPDMTQYPEMWSIVLQNAGQDALNAAALCGGTESFTC